MPRRPKAKMQGGDPRLPGFQGRPVKEMTGKFKIGTNVLDQRMQLDPNPHNSGDEVFHIIRSVVGDVDHKPTVLAAGVPFVRVEHYVVQEVVEVNGEDVQAYLDQSRQAIEDARLEAEQVDLAGGQGEHMTTAEAPTNDGEAPAE